MSFIPNPSQNRGEALLLVLVLWLLPVVQLVLVLGVVTDLAGRANSSRQIFLLARQSYDWLFSGCY
jgi:cytochrome c-type biogenesis protein CcmH/NrfF